jgi:hypothetical protein
MSDFWKDYEPEPTRAAPMTTDRALDLALEALEKSTDNFSANVQHRKAITAIKQARALDKKAENARELGLDYEPVLKDSSNYRYDPPVAEPVAYRQTGWAAHRDHYAVPVLFNPYTGHPRDVRDVQSDPQGILIVPPGKVEMLAAKPTHQQGLQVATPPAAQRQWVGLTDEEFEDIELGCRSTSSGKIMAMQKVEAKLKEKNSV